MNRDKLKRIVESIEAAEKSIKTYSDHKRDIYATNKDEFEPKVLRKIIARRKMDPESRTKDDDLLDQYETALGMVGELAKEAALGERTYDEAAEAAGVSRRTMARQIKRAKAVPESTDHGTPPHDPEVTEAASIGDDAGHRSEPSPPAEQSVNSVPSSGPVEATLHGGEGEQSGTHSVEGGAPNAVRDGGAPVETSTVGPAVTTLSPGVPDELQIPVHLRRERATA